MDDYLSRRRHAGCQKFLRDFASCQQWIEFSTGRAAIVFLVQFFLGSSQTNSLNSFPLQSDRTADYARAIREVCMKDDQMQMIVCILRSKRADHYQAIKVQSLCEFGILSQVINLLDHLICLVKFNPFSCLFMSRSFVKETLRMRRKRCLWLRSL